jgi:hypothetical protein
VLIGIGLQQCSSARTARMSLPGLTAAALSSKWRKLTASGQGLSVNN